MWRNPQLWGVVSAIAAVASAIAAFLTIQQSAQIRQTEIEAERPYFVIIDPKFQQRDDGLILNLRLENAGGRPADLVTYTLVAAPSARIMQADGALPRDALLYLARHEGSGELSPGQPFPWFLPARVRADMPPHLFWLIVDYRDALLGDVFRQSFAMTWEGADGTRFPPNLFLASRADADALARALSAYVPSPASASVSAPAGQDCARNRRRPCASAP